MLSNNENIYEKRLVSRLRTYWDRMKHDNDIPLSNNFSSNSLEDVWSSCLTLKVTRTPERNIYFCEYIGTSLKQALGQDLKDKYFNSAETGGIVSREFIKVLDRSVVNREFIMSQGQFINLKSKVVKYRDCVLPFQDPQNVIDMLIIGISWRSF